MSTPGVRCSAPQPLQGVVWRQPRSWSQSQDGTPVHKTTAHGAGAQTQATGPCEACLQLSMTQSTGLAYRPSCQHPHLHQVCGGASHQRRGCRWGGPLRLASARLLRLLAYQGRGDALVGDGRGDRVVCRGGGGTRRGADLQESARALECTCRSSASQAHSGALLRGDRPRGGDR